MSDMPKDAIRGFYESYNEGDLDQTWERYVAADLINHALGGAYDRDAWRETDKALFSAFAEVGAEVRDQVAEGDKVATRYAITATGQVADFFGIPASGATATLTGISFDRVSRGKFAEHWAENDLAGFLEQLKATATSAA